VVHVGDTHYELDETYTVTLSNPVNATIADGTGSGTIEDDDSVPEWIISASANGTEGGNVAGFLVQLSGTTYLTATVDVDAVSGTAVIGSF
jgi:chitinase